MRRCRSWLVAVMMRTSTGMERWSPTFSMVFSWSTLSIFDLGGRAAGRRFRRGGWSPVRRFETPHPGAVRAGEGPLDVAEKFALEEGLV